MSADFIHSYSQLPPDRCQHIDLQDEIISFITTRVWIIYAYTHTQTHKYT